MTSEASQPPKGRAPLESVPAVAHPRGRIAPLLPEGAPVWQRVARATVRLVQGLFLHDAFRIAPAMAFHFFLSLLPLLVFIGWVVGALVRRKGVDSVLAPFLESLPIATETLIEREARRLAGANRLGPLAAVGFLWIASGGTHGLMEAVEGVVGAPRRPWWKARLMAAGWVVASLLAIAIASFGVIQWDDAVHPDDLRPTPAATATAAAIATAAPEASSQARHPPQPAGPRRARRVHMLESGAERALALVLSLAAVVVALAVFYRVSVSHSKRVERRLFPGALLAVVLWLVISWGFGLYVRTLTDYAVFYGSLAAVAVLLVWLWLASLAILVGAELNAQLEGLRD